MKKTIYVDRFMLRKSTKSKLQASNELKIWTKKSWIINSLNIGTRIQIYNGSKFTNLTIARDMQGYVFGEFCFTKRITADIHVKSAKNVKVLKKK